MIHNSIFLNRLAVLLIVGVLGATGLARAEDNADLKRGIAEYRHENYDEALTALESARNADPSSSLAAYYIGMSYKRMQDYGQAMRYLTESLSLSPKIKGALIELVDVLYTLEEYEEAKKWIEVAEREGVRPAQAAYLKGLTLMKTGEYSDAIDALENAKSLDADLEMSAGYQIGMAYIKLENLDEAKDAFKHIVAEDPNSSLATYANRYLDAIEKRQERDRPWKFAVGYSFQVDDNVILKPSDVAAVADIADEGDEKHITTFSVENNTKLQDNWALKTAYSLYLSEHEDLSRFDVTSNTILIQPNLTLEKILISFPMSFNHTAVHDDAYVSSYTIGNQNNIMLSDTRMATVSFLHRDKNFRVRISEDETRTGDEYIGRVGWFQFFEANNARGFLSLNYAINKDDTEGQNWEYLGHRFTAAYVYPVTDKVKATLSADAFLKDFENRHTTLLTERNDDTYTLGASVAVELVKNLEWQFQYSYIRSDSNVFIYDYERNIVSTGVQYKF